MTESDKIEFMKPIFKKVKKLQDGIITQLINKLLSKEKNDKGLSELLTCNERWSTLAGFYNQFLAGQINYDKLKEECLKILTSNVPPTPEGQHEKPVGI